jgi:hypothetical protein
MLKKIILSVVAAVLLIGSERLLATETNPTTGAEQEKQVLQSGIRRPRQQEFDRYFNALTKAYRENDRETMGQMLRKMNQFRQNQQKAKAVPGKRGQDLPKRRGRGQDMVRQGQGMGPQGQGMGGRGRGMGGRGRGMGWQGRGRNGRGRGMGWQGRGRNGRGRGMGWQGRGMAWQGRGMIWQGQGMGGRGRGMAWQGQGRGGRGRGLGWQNQGNQRRKMNVPQRDDMPGEEFDWDL